MISIIKIGAVSYTNAKPLIYGLEKKINDNNFSLLLDNPSSIAKKWLYKEIDIGLIPIATLLKAEHYEILEPTCIACDGEVSSVGIFSNIPLEQITTVMCDYQSNTSVLLAKILAKFFWKKDFKFTDTKAGFENNISKHIAGIIIGDRAFEYKKKYKYYYDLGLEWKKYTQLPFVFAVWASNIQLSDNFKKSFSKLTTEGLENLNSIAENNKNIEFDTLYYYKENIKFILTSDMKKSMDLYFEYSKNILL